MNARQRRNLLKLADYLESLPKNYKHFDMAWFADHKGECKLPLTPEVYAAKNPAEFLDNCGTVACAVGHGPAAGIKVVPREFLSYAETLRGVDWHGYAARVFGVSACSFSRAFGFLFGAHWEDIDNHHYGAAARIRYYLDTGNAPYDHGPRLYAPYRKGSKARRVRDRSGEAVETAKTGSTVDKSPAPAGGDAQP